jgi:Pyruvate/2-oxoacid:ferredoxin oxidoreductase delta subunit
MGPPGEHTFRRFENGKSMWNWPVLSERIFQADRSGRCPSGVQPVPGEEHAAGRYDATDYRKCAGCHICRNVSPMGNIQMGLGE